MRCPPQAGAGGAHKLTGPVFVTLCLLCCSISRKGLRLMLALIRPIHSCLSSSDDAWEGDKEEEEGEGRKGERKEDG